MTNDHESAERDCYAGRKDGMPGFAAVMHDDPKFRKDTAQELARWILDGYVIERVTRHEAAEGIREFAEAKKALALNPPVPQLPIGGMFGGVE